MSPGSRHALATVAALLAALGAAAGELKVVTWNVWNGFNGGRTSDLAAGWLARQKPDLVALQELNGVGAEGLAKLASRWDHPHVVILKENGYPVGLTSRAPIEVVARHRQGLWHGCLQARTQGLEVLVVHLHPGDWRWREREMGALTAIIRPLVAAGRRVAVMGDFNAHSPADRGFLSGQGALRERRQGPNLRDGQFDHGVMEGFLAAGLADPSSTPAPRNRTFPTRVLAHAADPASQRGFLERIDFILLDPRTAAGCRELGYPDDPVLDKVSDHYPVVARIATAPTGREGDGEDTVSEPAR